MSFKDPTSSTVESWKGKRKRARKIPRYQQYRYIQNRKCKYILILSGDARGVTITVVGNAHGDLRSNLERVSISHNVNGLGKNLDPIILLPAMGKVVEPTVHLVWQSVMMKENSEFKPVKLR